VRFWNSFIVLQLSLTGVSEVQVTEVRVGTLVYTAVVGPNGPSDGRRVFLVEVDLILRVPPKVECARLPSTPEVDGCPQGRC